MKDMSTTDDVRLAESQSTASDSQDDEPMGPIAEEEDTSGNNNSLLATFGGAKKEDDDDEWAEFAENEEETTNNKSSTVKADEKPKYTFGASSGFGTKGWAATHQTIPTPSKVIARHTDGIHLTLTPFNSNPPLVVSVVRLDLEDSNLPVNLH
jgi:Ran-binding protein 3